MIKQKTIWLCSACGSKQLRWAGSCNHCKNWNSLVEKVEACEGEGRFQENASRFSKPMLIEEVDATHFQRIQTGYGEFNRLMGGGVVVGSLNLLGGEPGIGKSTVLLQLAKSFADQGLNVLYVCGEESAQQISMRAKRLGIKSDKIYLFSETLFSQIRMQITEIQPDILIIDSVQIVYKSDLFSSPGSVTQVREIAMECMHLSKGNGITTFLVGHVTKSGDIAGPRVLEHIVDTVLEFEGDRQHGYRLMRSVKNRFGPTDDVALFQMNERGLSEISNPSLVFLGERVLDCPGSVIIPTIEGTRALLIEVQALVTPSSFASPSRRSAGLDPKRLSLLLAVLEKRMGYQLHTLDVFVSIAGGMRITEPAIDLGTMLAIASCHSSQPIPSDTVIVGEVGLGGEVRSVPQIASRIKEAIHLGFKRMILSSKNFKEIHRTLSEKIILQGVSHVEEAIQAVLTGACLSKGCNH